MVVRLEIFESEEGAVAPDTVILDTSLLEEAKLASYDSGYSAGWEDATSAQSGDQSRIRADLARNLQALSFTYQEARSHILRALEPLIEQMTGKVLPLIARESLGSMVLDTLMPMAENMADAPVTLVLNPVVRAAVEPLVTEATGLPVVIEEEPTLSEGQVYLRFGAAETVVDLDRVTAEIAATVRSFFDISHKEA
ncbi:MAG: flagellar biosynthesis protein [Rhodobacteraceae bacterium]|nr:flagellar biosynthesis protein [Paracoccaceae bacterium]